MSRSETITDMIIVIITATVALLFLHKIVGIREGTVIAALIVGPIADSLIKTSIYRSGLHQEIKRKNSLAFFASEFFPILDNIPHVQP